MLRIESNGLINSSFAVLFHATAIVVGGYLSNLFPDYLGIMPAIVCIGLPILLFWFFYFLHHHTDITTAAGLFLTFAILCGLLALLSAAIGSNSNHTLPVATPAPTIPQITIPLLNLFFVSYTGSAPIIASVIMYYGALSYLITSLVALLLEWFYGWASERVLPTAVTKKLTDIDKKADKFMFNTFSNRRFMGQYLGVYASIAAIISFAVLYAVLLYRIQ